MLLGQQGYDWKRCSEALRVGLLDGIVISPRDTSPAKVPEHVTYCRQRGAMALLDLQWYALAWVGDGDARTGRATEHACWPGTPLHECAGGQVSEAVQRAVATQVACDCDPVVLPGGFIEENADQTYRVNEEAWDDALARVGDGRRTFITVAVSEHVLGDEDRRLTLLDSLTWWASQIDGVYLLPEAEVRAGHPLKTAAALAATMHVVHALRMYDLDVIVGYCGQDALLYGAAGATAVAVGTAGTTRRFGPDRWLETTFGLPEGMDHLPDWYLSPNLLYEMRLTDLQELAHYGCLDLVSCDCGHCDAIQAARDIPAIRTDWSQSSRYCHFLAVIRPLLTQICSADGTSQRCAIVSDLIDMAEGTSNEILAAFDPEPAPEGRRGPTQLRDWREAMQVFGALLR